MLHTSSVLTVPFDVAQELVDEFQKQSNSSAKLATIEEMQNFVEGFSEFSAAQRNAGKHVTLITELSRHVDSRNLMQVSSVEQDLVCSAGNTANLQSAYEQVELSLCAVHVSPNDKSSRGLSAMLILPMSYIVLPV